MCLTVVGFKTRKEAREAKKNPLIAKKDIIVYKVLDKAGKSMYRDFKYDKGFHYYQEGGKEFSYSREEFSWTRWRFNIYKGLHSYRTKQNPVGDYKDVKMIIPKGSKYYIGNNNDIVSNQLIYI